MTLAAIPPVKDLATDFQRDLDRFKAAGRKIL